MQQLQLFDLEALYPPHPMIARMELIYVKCKRLKRKLDELGYIFKYPTEAVGGPVIGGPAIHVDEKLHPLKMEFGAFPEALRQFYLICGSVNFAGNHPDWEGCEYPDPLWVDGVNWTLFEYNQWVEDKAYRREHNVHPFSITIAPDHLTKANVSGCSYNIYLPSESWDPIVEAICEKNWKRETLFEHLERSLQWGGFPGLANYENHTWPLDELLKAMNDE